MMKRFTATIEAEGDLFVSRCIELDIVSQGDTRETALANLREAVELFLETASALEIENRLNNGAFVAALDIAA